MEPEFWHQRWQQELIGFHQPSVNRYLEKYIDETEHSQESTEEDVSQTLLEFIEEDSLENLNTKQRIILVSHRYAKEVTSAVHWLIDTYEVDIKCVQLIEIKITPIIRFISH